MDNATNPVFSSPNRLKLGVFGLNLLSAPSKAPEVWLPTWPNCLAAGRMIDDFGIEAIVPVARWKGFLDDAFDHPSNEIFDVFTFAAAMAQATARAGIFVTTNAPTVHPLFLAKQAATIDWISGGRLTVNIVGGWNRREFDAFGIDLLPHAERYAYLGEWLGIVRSLWTADAEFDFQGKYFNLKGALSRPQPLQKGGVPIMNAGLSEVGNRFAAENADIGFLALSGSNPEEWAHEVQAFKQLARNVGREIQVWVTTFPTIRDSDDEAQAYYRYVSDEMLDRATVDNMMEMATRETPVEVGSARYNSLRSAIISGGGMPIIGSARTVADTFIALSEAGVEGVITRFVDQLDGIQRLGAQVIPLLERAGVRVPVA